MKTIQFFLFLFLVSFQSLAQIQFNSKFKRVDESKLPYGEPVLLFGKAEAALDSLIVSVGYQVFVSDGSSSNKIIRKEAEIDGLDWRITIDALPADSKILLTFDSYGAVSEERKVELGIVVASNFHSLSTSIIDGSLTLNADPDKTKKILVDKIKSALDAQFKNYFLSTTQTLYDGIITYVQGLTVSQIGNYVNNSLKIDKFISDYISAINKISAENIKVGQRNISEFSGKERELLDLEAEFSAALTAMKASATGATANIFDDLIAQFNGSDLYAKPVKLMRHQVTDFETEAINQSKILIRNSTSDFSSSESVTSNELLKYAGIDIAAVIFPKSQEDRNPAFVGYLFCISPYLHEIFGLTPKHKWMTNLTPTLGVGLSTSLADVKSPFFYTGFSYRINGAFRFTTGATFFKNDIAKPEFEWMFGAGFSLQLSSVGDLVRLFNATKTQFSNTQ